MSVGIGGIPSQTESDDLHRLIQHVKSVLQDRNAIRPKKLVVPELMPSLQSELGASLPLHVSLSRTLQVKTEHRDLFLDTLKRCLRRAAVRSFSFDFQGLKWVPNFERNRWFLVLSIKRPAQDELNRLLYACNEAAGRCGHPALYSGGEGDGPMSENDPTSPPKDKQKQQHHGQMADHSAYFHISIAWNLIEPDPEWISVVQDIDVSKYMSSPKATFDAVKVKIGNVVHSIVLGTGGSGLGNSGLLGLG